jgi:N-acyl-D-aspartate/D-glutamate deacylase
MRGPGDGGAGASRPAEPGGPNQAAAVEDAPEIPPDGHVYERVISGGRVIDPESGFDQVANLGIDGRTIAAIDVRPLKGNQIIDATNRVVSPGFIDLLSYEPEDAGSVLKLHDGVTTNLGMHGINANAPDFLAKYTGRSRVHFGGAFDNPFIRTSLFGVGSSDHPSTDVVARMAAECEKQIGEGWMGVDFEPEYSPGTTFEEIVALATVAKRMDVPCFFHGRYSGVGQNAQTLDEIINVARATGAAVHIEHILSTGGTFDMANSLARVQAAIDEGLDVTACMYPYDFWATYLGSPRFADGWKERFQIDYDDLQIAGTPDRLNATTFRRGRSQNMLAAAYAIPTPEVATCLAAPFVMIGSDGIITDGNNHPRGAGCFSRVLGRYVRDQPVIDLPTALAKMTIMPARRLEKQVPMMRRKGRLQRGADADITIFDPATVLDQATVEHPGLASVGIDWVLVLGTPAKTPAGVNMDLFLGEPITYGA